MKKPPIRRVNHRVMRTKRFLTVVSMIIAGFYVSKHTSSPSKSHLGGNTLPGPGVMFSFDTCGGLSNQILSISYAVTFAIVIKAKTLVLPAMLLDGRQIHGVDRFRDSATDDAFSRIFDTWQFSQILKSHGIELTEEHFSDYEVDTTACRRGEPLSACFNKAVKCKKQFRCLLHMECPFLHQIWAVNFVHEHVKYFDSVFYGLKLNPVLEQEYGTAVENFRRVNRIPCMTVIHARIEDDWLTHCRDWKPNYPKNYKFDCMIGLDSIFHEVEQHTIGLCPIYLAYDIEDISDDTKRQISKFKRRYKLPVYDWHDLKFQASTTREIRAATQLSMAKNAEYFFGNTVSTLSAIIMRFRRNEGRWAAQYNTGFNPLSEFVPGYGIPWVFTLSRSHDVNYDTLMKAAVNSARAKTSLLPICVAHTDEDRQGSRIKWLMQRGVRVLFHKPKWDKELLNKLSSSTKAQKETSHLYANEDMVLSTFFRLDISIIPEVSQFEHVLYTDIDVYFRNDITNLQGIGLRLPDSIQMGYEAVDKFPYNAGVFLASARFLRATHHLLLKKMIENKGISYGFFGPGDQGLLNMVYERELRSVGALDKAMNAKPYHAFSQNAAIVHFHGPKPTDYLAMVNSNKCNFGKMCARGLQRGGACRYVLEWIEYVPMSERGQFAALEAKCKPRWFQA